MKKEIIIDISDNGEIRLETSGFTGKACIEETEFLKELLGKETFQQLTPTYYTNQNKQTKKYLQICG
ncbi:MAG: DUF2997 domain-containing protein [Desulfobacterales bacterium]|nr:DUF2997 domain-containing protein [Desulfobacterales bacterium]